MGFRLMGLVVIPAAAILLVLARPIVNALLDYGSFTAKNGAATAQTLAWFAVGLFSFSAYLFTLRGFYAMQDTRTPFLLNCLENGINIAFALALVPALRRRGARRVVVDRLHRRDVRLARVPCAGGSVGSRGGASSTRSRAVLGRDRGARRARVGRGHRHRLRRPPRACDRRGDQRRWSVGGVAFLVTLRLLHVRRAEPAPRRRPASAPPRRGPTATETSVDAVARENAPGEV